MKRVLFLCTHNSARSQMAEGLLRAREGRRFEVSSAGTGVTSVHPLAILVMRELGIEISGHRSKSVAEFEGQTFEYVITVCDQANEACPIFPGAQQRLHWSFDDPSTATGDVTQRLGKFRRIRDEIEEHIREFLSEDSDSRAAQLIF